jgi:hypothetical protein
MVESTTTSGISVVADVGMKPFRIRTEKPVVYTEEPNYYHGCRELRDREEVYFEGMKDDIIRFYFRLDKPMMFDVHAWPTAAKSGPDLYIGYPQILPKATDEECSDAVSQLRNTWKSQDNGPNHVMVNGDDPKMIPGVYWVTVIPFCRDTVNKMAIKLKLTEPKVISPLLNGIPQTVTLKDSLFFKYEIIGDGEEKNLFDDVYTLLQVSKKQGIQLYMHNYDRYPSSDNWLCAFGDIDKELVNLFNMRAYMRSMCF